MDNIAEQLRQAALQDDRSINALAREAGLGYPIVYEFLHGRRAITISSAAQLCRVLQLELRPIARRRRKG